MARTAADRGYHLQCWIEPSRGRGPTPSLGARSRTDQPQNIFAKSKGARGRSNALKASASAVPSSVNGWTPFVDARRRARTSWPSCDPRARREDPTIPIEQSDLPNPKNPADPRRPSSVMPARSRRCRPSSLMPLQARRSPRRADDDQRCCGRIVSVSAAAFGSSEALSYSRRSVSIISSRRSNSRFSGRGSCRARE